MEHSTIRFKIAEGPSRDEAVPGVVLAFSNGQPRCHVLALYGGALVLGRGDVAGISTVDDELMSRRHARITFKHGTWTVEDLDSTNGTLIDGEKVHGEVHRASIRVIRAGGSVFLPLPDVRRFLRRQVTVREGIVLGPALQEAHDAIARAAAAGDCLLITGESGTGKELAARTFHHERPRAQGPFVPVNCAAIPEGLAERLLFGARRGAYSGATHDTDGYVQAAHGGTLFLDEIAELDAAVQAKLLRTIDTKQVLELGAVTARPVQIRICAATHDLRARMEAGKFRQDLYYRIGRPEVRLPPLRGRPEEIPYLLHETVTQVHETATQVGRDARLSVDVSLVIACLLRAWPGNVRELIGEIRQAALRAMDEGRCTVEGQDLDPQAGMGVILRDAAGEPQVGRPRGATLPPEDQIAEALRIERGNISRAATRLGVHRNKVRRWLEKNSVDRAMFAPGGAHARDNK